MRKFLHINFLVCLALLLFAAIIFSLARTDPKTLDREMGFWGALKNTLVEINQAKWKWADENHKPESSIPTMEDLSPYLENWTNTIRRLEAFGVNYKITPFSESENQSDVATLTREVYFHIGFCRYYPAGVTYSLHNGFSIPQSDAKTEWRAFYFANREILAVAIFALAVFNLFILAVIKLIKLFRRKLKPKTPAL